MNATRHEMTDVEYAKLRTALLNGVTMFCYFSKKDDGVRTAYGTLNPQLLSKLIPKGDDEQKKRETNANLFPYFDLEKKAFRSFNKSNYIGMYNYVK